jgi:3-deoxy-D-manno-octulosonic acid kinase
VQLPAGYVDYDRGKYRVIAPRLALDEMIALLTGPQRESAPASGVGGRGGTHRLVLPGGKTVFLRKYLRGGFARHFARDLYVLRPERPLRELIVTEAARAAGCPVPHVLAICIEEAGIGYRGWLVTEAIDAARPLVDVVGERDAAAGAALLAKAAEAIRGLHAAGVYHVDLNGHNVLVGPGDRISFVDFDRAYLAEPLLPGRTEAALARLGRSLAKLGAAPGLALDRTAAV